MIKKKSLVKKVKKQAWELFSKYTRLKNADEFGMVVCVTCGVRKHWKEMQAGHFLPGRHNTILFSEEQVNPQCYHCNIGLKGNWPEYIKWMNEKYGEERVKEMIYKTKEVKQFKAFELIEIKEKYAFLVKNIEQTLKVVEESL